MTVANRPSPLCGSPIYGGYLTRYQTYADYPALACVPRVLAGQARMLWEHASGEALEDDSTGAPYPTCAPRNPMGVLGEAHCGAPFGKPFVHTPWVWAQVPLEDPPDLSGVDYFTRGPKLERDAGAVLIVGFDVDVLVPWPAGSAYTTARVDAAMYVTEAAYGSGAYAEFDVFPDGHDTPRTITYSVTSTGYTSGDGPLTNFDMIPGAYNRIRVRLSSDFNGAFTVYLQVLAFSQPT